MNIITEYAVFERKPLYIAIPGSEKASGNETSGSLLGLPATLYVLNRMRKKNKRITLNSRQTKPIR